MTDRRSCIDAFRSEFDYLCRTLQRLGVRREDIEDEAHEVFLVLSRKWEDFDQTRPLRPFLFGIAFRVAAARKRRWWRELSRDIEEPASATLQPDEAYDAAQSRDLVLRALALVPLPRRAVLVMHDVDEMPMRDIAEALSLPLFTGYSRLRKARREFEAAVRALKEGTPEP